MIEWDNNPAWGLTGFNVHESATGSWLEAEAGEPS